MRRVGHRRFALVALATALIVVGVGCSDAGTDGGAAREPGGTTVPSPVTTVVSGRSPEAGPLPIGEDDSPYWVAHDLPDGYALLDGLISDSSPFGGSGVPAPTTGYGPAGNSRFDADLWVAAMEWDAPEDFWEGAATEAEMDETFKLVTVRGKDGFEYPLSGDGRDYGTTLAWEERPGLWITVQAAEPLTRDDAYAVAEGLQPFPEEQWDDLLMGLDTRWFDDRAAVDAAPVVGVVDALEMSGWRLDAMVPPRLGEPAVDRRWPCARLTVEGGTVVDAACAGPGWYTFDEKIYVVGVAPMEATTVTVRSGGTEVDASLHWVDVTPGFQYWVADLGEVGCAEYQVEFEPAGLTDQLSRSMTGQGGPTEGCGRLGPDNVPAPEGLPPDSATVPAD